MPGRIIAPIGYGSGNTGIRWTEHKRLFLGFDPAGGSSDKQRNERCPEVSIVEFIIGRTDVMVDGCNSDLRGKNPP